MAETKTLQVKFPQGKIWLKETETTLKSGIIKVTVKPYIQYNPSYRNFFNNNLNKSQVFLDNKVIIALQKYVSKKYGGSGLVHIGVPYAEYQAYSKRIKKRAGLRGTQPWERMVADNKDSILMQVAEYNRRLNR